MCPTDSGSRAQPGPSHLGLQLCSRGADTSSAQGRRSSPPQGPHKATNRWPAPCCWSSTLTLKLRRRTTVTGTGLPRCRETMPWVVLTTERSQGQRKGLSHPRGREDRNEGRSHSPQEEAAREWTDGRQREGTQRKGKTSRDRLLSVPKREDDQLGKSLDMASPMSLPRGRARPPSSLGEDRAGVREQHV